MNPELDFEQTLKDLMFQAQTEKEKAVENQGAVVARRWAVFYTDLEKAYAYYVALLKSKESES